jgi:hypothetical protein
MALYKKKQKPAVSAETIQEAEAIAKGTQRPGQTKEQTKLIAQGIQKGIEEYKKRQKGKARELDKKLRKVNQPVVTNEGEVVEEVPAKSNRLPWVLLVLTWVGIALFYALVQFKFW